MVDAARPLDDGPGRRPLVALLGPTASGKTALSLALADHLPVEIVSADSRMVYRWMDIGTAKPSWQDRTRVPHHLLDVVDPDEPYSVALYQQQALAALGRIHARGRLPLLVGGTGLYVRAVCDGLQIPAVPPDAAFREALERQAERDGAQVLQAQLEKVDPESAGRIDPHNVRRVIRALEVQRTTGTPFSTWQRRTPPPFHTIFVGLDVLRHELYRRIDLRAQAQVDAGLIEEVQSLQARGYDSSLTSMNGFGYREIALFLRGELDRVTAIERYQRATRRYARRQLTWFRPDARVHWLDAAEVTPLAVVRILEQNQVWPA